MKINAKVICLLFLFLGTYSYSQEKDIQISLGTIKTELKDNAIDFGIKYVKSLDSIWKNQDYLFDGDNYLFQITPEFNVQSGTEDAFSNINLKIQGVLIFFKTTQVAGQITPSTESLMHNFPVSIGLESNNKFNFINGIAEIGYSPWYQSPMMAKVPEFIKNTKVGVFIQTGYKFDIDNPQSIPEGGEIDESEENLNDGILRAKFNFGIDTKSMFEIGGIGVGITGDITTWYDFLNSEVYYNIQGKTRFYLNSSKDKSFDLKYQKGSGAPNFNQGEQFGMGLTVTF